MNKSTSNSTVFRGTDTQREIKLGELGGEVPTIDAEPLIDAEGGSVVFRGADDNREMYLQEVAPHMASMKAMPLVDYSEDDGSRVFRGTDTRREIPLEVIAPNLVPNEEVIDENKPTGEEYADTSVVFRGTDTNREALLRTLADNLHWDEKEEDKFMQRVKAKALERVNKVLSQAKSRAEQIIQEAKDKTVDIQDEIENQLEDAKKKVQEAENTAQETKSTLQNAEDIKQNAYNEGYNAGLEQARLEAEKAKEDRARAVGTILLSIHGQCITIFNSWREDLTQLLYHSVEKSTNYVLDTEKKAILENLLEQSTNGLLDAREYTLRVNPNDVEMLEMIFEEKHKGQEKRWTIKPDESLASGGVILESPSGLIKNTQEERASIVDDILAKLSLPLSQGDQDAYDVITNVVIEESAQAGIILNEEKKEEPEKEENQAQEETDTTAEIAAEASTETLETSETTVIDAPSEEESHVILAPRQEESDSITSEEPETKSPIVVHSEKGDEIVGEAKESASSKLIVHSAEEVEEAEVAAVEEVKEAESTVIIAGEKREEKTVIIEHEEPIDNEEKFAAIIDEIDIEDEAQEMVNSGLQFDINEEDALKEENALDAKEMAPPFEDKMKVLKPKNDTVDSNKEEIADEILDAMGFSK